MASYTLKFSDPNNTGTITVVGAPAGTGVNNYDTSLSLVGPGYVNYGLDNAQNFLKLLENFTGPNSPANAIKGQLWFDTSDSNRPVLRINNGAITTNRWPAVSGIYQQAFDPTIEYTQSVKEGDIWVDLSTNQLKIRYSGNWTVVGPTVNSGDEKTGSESTELESSTGTVYPVILNWVNGKVVQTLSQVEFTPRSAIDGIPIIKAGSTLNSRLNARYYGLSEKALALEISSTQLLRPADILKNRSTTDQVHTGTLVIESTGGLKVRNNSIGDSIRIYSSPATGGLIGYTSTNLTLKVGVDAEPYFKFNSVYNNIGLNTNTNSLSPTLDIFGDGRYSGALTVNDITVNTTATITGKLDINGYAEVAGMFTATGGMTIGNHISAESNDTYDIGSSSNAFRTIYVSRIGTTGTYAKMYGEVVGSVSTLTNPRSFLIYGQVTATSVSFNGSANALFNTTLTSSAITAQSSTSTTTASQTLLVVNTATSGNPLQKISKAEFLADLYPYIVQTGMIVPSGTSTVVSGWLLCDGSAYTNTSYTDLFDKIGTRYGTAGAGQFRVPNLQNLTTSTTVSSTASIFYHIKT